jgi:undecaprenyl-diphosphatase
MSLWRETVQAGTKPAGDQANLTEIRSRRDHLPEKTAVQSLVRALWKRLLWLGGHELVVLAGLLLIVAGLWSFIALADAIRAGHTPALDDQILRALRQPDDPAVPVGPRWMAEAMRDITALGGPAVIALVVSTVAGFLILDRKLGAAALVLLATTLGFALSELLKAAFDRPRPHVVPLLTTVTSASFPSGHSMMSAVVYLTLGALLTRLVSSRWMKFYFLAVAAALSGLIGISRLYLGVHYPTDVLAGWSAGLVWAACCWLVARQLQRRGSMERKL